MLFPEKRVKKIKPCLSKLKRRKKKLLLDFSKLKQGFISSLFLFDTNQVSIRRSLGWYLYRLSFFLFFLASEIDFDISLQYQNDIINNKKITLK